MISECSIFKVFAILASAILADNNDTFECAVCNKSMLVYVGTVRTVNQKFVGMFSIVKLVVIRCYEVLNAVCRCIAMQITMARLHLN